jgi:hypothetical protein
MKPELCKDCALCCQHLLVEADAVDVLREPRIQAVRPLKNVSGSLSVHDACWVLAGPGMPCKFLTRQKRCGIYPTRPNTCVAFLAGSNKCQVLRWEHGLLPQKPRPDLRSIMGRFMQEMLSDDMGEPSP